MALTSFNNDPLFSLLRFPDEFSTLFDPPMRTYVRDSHAMASTAVDVKETPNSFQFVADLPGLKREEVKVQLEEGNVLSIAGERTREKSSESETFHRRERSTGKFLRRFRLPDNADASKISATAENGVLTIEVPKIPPKEPEKPKVIEVEIK
jgi:HSP20 family protein